MSRSPLSGEVAGSKVAASYETAEAARAASQALPAEVGLVWAQIRTIAANEPDIGIKLEPEGGNIWRTVLRAHLVLGLAGLLGGAAVYGLLTAFDVGFVVNSPWASAGACLFFGAVAGLLAGGMVALRPDHARYVDAVRSARDRGRTTVVVHARSSEEGSRAAEALERMGGEVTRTW